MTAQQEHSQVIVSTGKMKAFGQKFAALFSLAMIYAAPVGAQTWDSIQQAIRRRFPAVRQLSTSELSNWLADTNRSPRPLLVDARSAEEFAVSHLRDALHFVSVDQLKDRRTGNAQPIIVYCSVGYRSSAVAEKLQRSGKTNVWNLEGSLFAWANEGRPVYRGATLLTPAKVHPYDKKWGQLLRPECRAAP